MTLDPLRVRLAKLGGKRAVMEGIQKETSTELPALVTEAKAAGIPIAEIARLVGLSRQGVYDLLDR
jgi:hypothetical protein